MPQFACYLPTIHSWHGNVHEYDIGAQFLGILNCLLAVGCAENLMAQVLQKRGMNLSNILDIINDKNSHGLILLPAFFVVQPKKSSYKSDSCANRASPLPSVPQAREWYRWVPLDSTRRCP
jgi:hypothetical protein